MGMHPPSDCGTDQQSGRILVQMLLNDVEIVKAEKKLTRC